jgi:hypothetical protein
MDERRGLGEWERIGPGWPKPRPWRPAWIDLPRLFRGDGSSPNGADGIDTSKPVKGVVSEWTSTPGMWIGLCQYEVTYMDGRERLFVARDQLLPATFLAPRQE